MIIGLDMGGTNVDAVLLSEGRIKKTIKSVTDHENIFESIKKPLDEIMEGEDIKNIKKIVLSTTISTNAIVEGKTEEVGMVLECGPGMNPQFFKPLADICFVSGYIDHRGREAFPLNSEEIRQAKETFKKKGLKNLGVVGKFSVRNPDHEKTMYKILKDKENVVTMGHTLSGMLNFSRRVYSTYLNSAVYSHFARFKNSVEAYFLKKGIKAPAYVLKADGGTLSLESSSKFPVETILSGPSASIIGALALNHVDSDGIILDIGGTTTDIAVLSDGVPLFEPQGIEINGMKTLVRGLFSRSIGIGGDSYVRYENGEIKIGPERRGKAMAFGGQWLTLTDALISAGKIDTGLKSKAEEGIKLIAEQMGVSFEEAVKAICKKASTTITDYVRKLIREINNKPVYTINELLYGKKIQPQKAVIIGGPAKAMSELLEDQLGFPCIVPEHFEVANAYGAARSRTTTDLTLLADTALGILTIGEEGIKQKIPKRFDVTQAHQILMDALKQKALKLGADERDLEPEIVEEQSFNVVRGFYTTGKIIRLKAQIRPVIKPE
ncbi:MAG: hypothetical protein PWQ82_302 [Thermosediminibacterales bacterium]|nr:hypothetical protein [Thermosediminibacterales bacterium]